MRFKNIPPDIEEFLKGSGFRDPGAARKRLHELFRDTAEMLALARISGLLKDLLSECPDPDAALLHLARFVEVRGSRLQLYRSFLDHPALLDRFIHVVASSRYLADILVRNPEYLALLSDASLLSAPRPLAGLTEEMKRVCANPPAEEEKLDAMRRLFRREVLRIGAADLLGFQDLTHTTLQISELADAFVGQCLSVLAGGPDRSGLIVLALGKWGGRELNYSSDVDVIFLARRSEDVPQATLLARRLIRALSEPTSEGVVYRVDIRLRPYGTEGALVLTTGMFEDYLRTRAHPAERQAMLKARAVAGAVAAGRRFLRKTVPLLLRDAPSARQQVRKLKARIEKQLQARGEAGGHVKLAPGGIRDVEFLVQALQLEAGAARPGVLGGHTLKALRELEKADLLAGDDAQALRDGYVFLRTVEHRMQLMGNQQVYRLPRGEEELKRLGRTLGFRGPDSGDRLLDAYDARTRKVRSIFDRVLAHAASPRPAGDPEALRQRMGSAGERLDRDLIRRCGDLLDGVKRPRDVKLHAQRGEGRRWTIAIAAAKQAGLLPLVAGLFTAHRINILSGDFLTLQLESKKVLGVFEVSLPDRVPRKFWESFRDKLERLEGEDVLDRVAETLRPSAGPDVPLPPVRIEIRNDAAARETELHIHSPDTPGFLFEFSTALAALNIEVARAAIRTLEDEIYDTFWVTDLQGRKIVDAAALEELRVAAALVKQFTHLLPRSPNPAQALRQFTALLYQMFARPEWVPELRSLESSSVLSTIAKLMGVSRFLWEDFLLMQHENLFPVVCDLDKRKSKAQLARELKSCRSPDDAVAFKDREMFRIDLRHITRRSDFREFISSLSDLAEVAVAQAAALCNRRSPSPWSICALGKFGGRELGIASDLDIVFVYEREDFGAFFSESVRRLREMMKARREGSFEIDLRLRPHGDSGALACSLEGFRRYYSEEGPARQFERLALVKLNPVAGDPALSARIVKARDAFVYSAKRLDYDDIAHLRRRQAAELVAAGEINAKYSPGGLVDVEYFVQALQIEADVRVANTLEAIDRLVRTGHVRAGLGSELTGAYLFLRRLIDALRVVRGYARDSKIPAGDLPDFAYLVRRLEYNSPAQLEAEIRQRMSFARNLWSETRFRNK